MISSNAESKDGVSDMRRRDSKSQSGISGSESRAGSYVSISSSKIK